MDETGSCQTDESAVFEGLTKMSKDRIQVACRTKVLFPTVNKPSGASLKIKIVVDDVKLHRETLELVMSGLGGRAPRSDSFARAIHRLDQSYSGRISGACTQEEPTLWSAAEGLALHGMIVYMHKLRRAHEGQSSEMHMHSCLRFPFVSV